MPLYVSWLFFNGETGIPKKKRRMWRNSLFFLFLGSVRTNLKKKKKLGRVLPRSRKQEHNWQLSAHKSMAKSSLEVHFEYCVWLVIGFCFWVFVALFSLWFAYLFVFV